MSKITLSVGVKPKIPLENFCKIKNEISSEIVWSYFKYSQVHAHGYMTPILRKTQSSVFG